jgi:hypothetical protein
MRHPRYVDVWGLLLGAALGFLAASGPGCNSSSTPVAPPKAIGDDASAAAAAPQAEATVAPDASDAGGEPREAAADASDDSATDGAADVVTPAEASADAAPDAAPDIDAGAGCLSPGTESPLSAASAGLPADGLALWVRADRGVYMTAQSEVCAWKDQSGNDRLLSAASTRPIWQGASVGGMPAIHFSAVGTDLYTPDLLGIGATSARTFIAVAELVNTTGRFHPILQGQGNSAGTYLGIDANTWQTAGSLEGVYVTNNSYDTALATSASPRVHVLTVTTLMPGTAVTAAIDYRVNGATQTFTIKAGSGTLVDFSAADFTAVGAVSGTPSTPGYGDAMVAEALIYDRALTVNERAAAEAALEARYGIH